MANANWGVIKSREELETDQGSTYPATDKNFRIMSYGDASYYRLTYAEAEATARQVMARNGCGCIAQRQPSGPWKLIARYEPYYGVVLA